MDCIACVECLVCHCMSIRWGVTQVGKFHYWPLLTLSREELFQVPKTHLGMGRIREAKKWPYVVLVCIFVKIWAKDPVLDNLYSKQIVIELFLYTIYISCCMDVWAPLGHFTHVWVL